MRTSHLFVLDTCVLLSNVVRRVLLDVASTGLVVPFWSDAIADEWRRNAARLWKVTDEEVAAQWDAMQLAFPQANLVGWEPFVSGLQYSDAKDWHVIAAARLAQQQSPAADIAVITYNTRDFNRSELRRLRLRAKHPDEALCDLWPVGGAAIVACLNTIFDEQESLTEAERTPFITSLLKRERLFRLNKYYLMRG